MKQMLSVENVQKSFDGTGVLKGISLSVNEGEVLAIIGPSGSGKSTLLRCITQLESVDSGKIVICGDTLVEDGKDGRAVYASRETCVKIGLHIGLVFQNFNLFPHYTVLKKHCGRARSGAEKKQAGGGRHGQGAAQKDGAF